MRLHQYSTFTLLFGSGLALSAATASVACGTKNLDCEASRTCAAPPSNGSGGSKSEAGAADQDEHGTSSGKGAGGGGGAGAGQGGAVAQGGRADDTDGLGGTSGHGHAGEAGDGSDSDTHGQGGESDKPRSSGGAESVGGAGGRAGAPGMSAGSGMAGLAGSSSVPPGDTTPPQLTSISPPNGTSGVQSDVDIVLTFSEPMDTLSVQAAYQSSDLPPAAVDFSWKNESTMLVIHPKVPLGYANVTDLAAAAKRYAYKIASSGKDLAGNHLPTNAANVDVELGFTTLRHVTQALGVKSGGLTTCSHPTTGAETVRTGGTCRDGSTVMIGKDSVDTVTLPLFQFDLSTLPVAIVAWQSAVFSGSHSVPVINPYLADHLGNLHLFSTAIDPNTFGLDSPMNDLGVIGDYTTGDTMSLDVKSAVADDYAHRDARGNVSEYVLHFEKWTDDTPGASWVWDDCTTIRLTLDYLVP